MIVDSSAVVAILLRQEGHQSLRARLDQAEAAGIGAPTLTETGMVLASRLGIRGKTLLARFLQETEMEVVPFGSEHWPVAVDALARYGKGRHAAALNFGDCMAYAVARVAARPLLCVGEDFRQTDLTVAAP